MKHFFPKTILLFMLLATAFVQAQERNCSAMDNLEIRKKADPKLASKMAQIEQYTQAKANELIIQKSINGSIISIPVVVHVVYNTAQQNISDAQIQSQIDVLNEDFRRINADRDNVWSQAADMQIEFCLAQTDPNGAATNGITRKSSTRASWGTNDDVKKLSQGGVNPWDASQYLNMWVANIGGSLLGYAQFPGGAASTDGVVMSPQYFGSSDKGSGFFLSAPFDKGRTTTHEVGHFLNLRHIWGDGGCGVDDFVTDTPESDASNGGCNIGHVSCGSVDMVQNYMDYSDDGCMNLFTVGQKARMRASLLSGGPRASLANSTKCNTPAGGVGSTNCQNSINSFPYNAGFENTLNSWTQDSSDDFDWTVTSGTTPSSGTGPTTAAVGSYYVYVEASSPNSPAKTTILNSPCFNLTGLTSPRSTFKYQMTGNAVGTVKLEIRENGSSSWSTIWSATGDQGAAWKDATVSLNTYANKTVQLRFVGTTGNSWQGDIAIDAFDLASTAVANPCSGGVSSFPYGESFENTLGAWTQDTSDTLDWTLRSGTTPSGSTGPSGAAAGTYYIYVEASDPNFNKTARLISPCFNLSNQNVATLSFQYQMTGNAVGVLSVEASNNNGASYTSIFNKSGDQGAAWQTATVNLAAYTGGILKLRLTVNTTSSWQGDIAIDDIKVTTTAPVTDRCAGVAAYSSTTAYSVGDRVTYQGFLFERAANAWNNLGACGTARAQGELVSIPDATVVTIYPNPVSDAFVSVKGVDGLMNYVILNIAGQQIQAGTVENNRIPVGNLKANLYLLQISTEKATTTLKFVKE